MIFFGKKREKFAWVEGTICAAFCAREINMIAKKI